MNTKPNPLADRAKRIFIPLTGTLSVSKAKQQLDAVMVERRAVGGVDQRNPKMWLPYTVRASQFLQRAGMTRKKAIRQARREDQYLKKVVTRASDLLKCVAK